MAARQQKLAKTPLLYLFSVFVTYKKKSINNLSKLKSILLSPTIGGNYQIQFGGLRVAWAITPWLS
jgi:hypothetical protein